MTDESVALAMSTIHSQRMEILDLRHKLDEAVAQLASANRSWQYAKDEASKKSHRAFVLDSRLFRLRGILSNMGIDMDKIEREEDEEECYKAIEIGEIRE